MAVVEAVKSYAPGYEDFPIHIKWPNDICRFCRSFSVRAIDDNKAMI